MGIIRIRAADAASALNEVARRFGDDALILSTTQTQGGVEVAVAHAAEDDGVTVQITSVAKPVMVKSAPLPDLPARLVLVGAPGAGVTLLAARLAAQHLRRVPLRPPVLVAPRTDILAPVPPLTAHARLLALTVLCPIAPDPRDWGLASPDPALPQIIDLSALGAAAQASLAPLLAANGATGWLVLPTGLHVQAQDRIIPPLRPYLQAIALTRADICPLTLEDRALPQRFGLPIAVVGQGTGILDSLRVPDASIAQPIPLDQKDTSHVAARLSR
jgi:hypothetical protein